MLHVCDGLVLSGKGKVFAPLFYVIKIAQCQPIATKGQEALCSSQTPRFCIAKKQTIDC
jgi:hypothetical protein